MNSNHRIALCTVFLLLGIAASTATPAQMPTPVMFLFVAGEAFLMISTCWV